MCQYDIKREDDRYVLYKDGEVLGYYENPVQAACAVDEDAGMKCTNGGDER